MSTTLTPASTIALTTEEQDKLVALERTVDAGLKTFYEVGNALAEIRERRLYRESFTSFEDYLRGRWGMSRPRAYQLIAASEVVDSVSTRVDKPVPSERHARELSRLPQDERADCWESYLSDCEGMGRKATAKGLREQVDAWLHVTDEQEPVEPSDLDGEQVEGDVPALRVADADDEPEHDPSPVPDFDTLIKSHAQPWDRWSDWRVAVHNISVCCKHVGPTVVADALEKLAAHLRDNQ